MTTKDQISTTLVAWLKAETGLKVILTNQAAPRPERPYVSVGFLNASDRLGGTDEQIVDPVTRKVTVAGMRSAVASINIFGENAIDTLAKVRDSLDRPDVIERFAAVDMVHLDESPIQDLTALEETAYLERGQFDLTIGFAVESEVDVGTIEHVELETTIGGQTDTIDGP
jgi:hypothetical protein